MIETIRSGTVTRVRTAAVHASPTHASATQASASLPAPPAALFGLASIASARGTGGTLNRKLDVRAYPIEIKGGADEISKRNNESVRWDGATSH